MVSYCSYPDCSLGVYFCMIIWCFTFGLPLKVIQKMAVRSFRRHMVLSLVTNSLHFNLLTQVIQNIAQSIVSIFHSHSRLHDNMQIDQSFYSVPRSNGSYKHFKWGSSDTVHSSMSMTTSNISKHIRCI